MAKETGLDQERGNCGGEEGAPREEVLAGLDHGHPPQLQFLYVRNENISTLPAPQMPCRRHAPRVR